MLTDAQPKGVCPSMMGRALLSAFLLTILIGEAYSRASSLTELPTWSTLAGLNTIVAIILLKFLPNLRRALVNFKIRTIFFVPSIAVVFGAVLLSVFFPSSGGARPENLGFIVTSIILVPIIEEVIFRGAIAEFLNRKLPQLWAVYLTSIVFSMAHTSPTIARLVSLEVGAPLGPFLLGIVCGTLTLKSRSLVPAIAFHCACNSTVLIFNRLSPDWFDRLSALYL